MLPTRRLAALVLATAPLWLLSGSTAGAAVAAAISTLVALAALGDTLATPSRNDVQVERELPPSVGIGESAPGEYRIVTRWPRPVVLTLHDALPRGLDDGPAAGRAPGATAREQVRVGPGGIARIPFAVTGRERGRWRLGQIALRAAGPLGLTQRTLRYAPDDSITVTPSLAGVRGYRLLSLQHRLRDAGVRAIRRRGEGTSFSALREYTLGDDPRHIDWKATARRRKLISREYAVEQGQTVLIAIDGGRMMTQIAGELPRFEYALSSAMVLADVAVHSGDRVGLILFDDEVRAFVPAARGAAALQGIRQALVPAKATMTEPDYAVAFRMLAARHRKRSLIVLFTDVIDPRASQALIAHTVRSAARHLPLVVALRNQQLVAAAVPADGATPAQLYESAAAEELAQARNEALLRMRRAGVSVVDVAPEAMTAAVVNRYLEIKARASL
ncbi:MAG: DUF58 domain-containing protein [Gemmatimonadaceae bacterium]